MKCWNVLENAQIQNVTLWQEHKSRDCVAELVG